MEWKIPLLMLQGINYYSGVVFWNAVPDGVNIKATIWAKHEAALITELPERRASQKKCH